MLQTHSIQELQPSKIEVPPLFGYRNLPAETALKTYNSVLIEVNKATPPKTIQQLSDNRMKAISLFIAGQGKMATKNLADALRLIHGYWVNGEPDAEAIRHIFTRLNSALSNSLCGITQYRSNTAKMESRPTIRRITYRGNRRRNQGPCLAHPERAAIARGMCSSCYSKAFRLGILHLNLGEWLPTLLKRRKPSDSSHCVNHATVRSYADGHCVECLHRLGKLEKELAV